MSEIRIARQGQEWGPYPVNAVNEMLVTGQFSHTDLAWTEGLAEWVPLGRMPGILSFPSHSSGPPEHLLAVGPPVPLPPAPAQPQSASSRSRTSAGALAGLIAGILALMFFVMPVLNLILALTAVICSHVGRRNIQRSRGRLAGRGMGIAGGIMGFVALGLSLFVTVSAGRYVFKQLKEKMAAQPDGNHELFRNERAAHKTVLIQQLKENTPAPEPGNPQLQRIGYPAPLGQQAAYVSSTAVDPGLRKLPAIIWLMDGFGNSIGEELWTPGPVENDQSATAFQTPDLIVMFPSLRGGNQNPGWKEGLYGEVDDVLAALKWLQQQPGVDPTHVYLGGHGTGGTLALLTAEASPDFRAIFSFGPVSRTTSYGQENLPFDVSDPQESRLRAPIGWLSAISSPTYVFEGTRDANTAALQEMKLGNKNPKIQFFLMQGQDHFSGLRGVSRMLAMLIKRDSGGDFFMQLSDDAVAASLQK